MSTLVSGILRPLNPLPLFPPSLSLLSSPSSFFLTCEGSHFRPREVSN